MRRVIYIASSVTNASPEHEEFIAFLKDRLRMIREDIVLDWLTKSEGGELKHFYNKDMNNVRSSDAMIVVLDEPSIGVGMEINEAIRTGKPFLCLVKEGMAVSRLLEHASEDFDIQIQQYRGPEDALAVILKYLERLWKARDTRQKMLTA